MRSGSDFDGSIPAQHCPASGGEAGTNEALKYKAHRNCPGRRPGQVGTICWSVRSQVWGRDRPKTGPGPTRLLIGGRGYDQVALQSGCHRKHPPVGDLGWSAGRALQAERDGVVRRVRWALSSTC